MNFLFPYMARWKAVNWTRYHYIFTHLANMGHNVYVLQSPSANLKETNFQEIEVDLPKKLFLLDVDVNPLIWNMKFPLNKIFKKGYYCMVSRKMVKTLIEKYKIDVLFLYNIPQHSFMEDVDCLKVFDYADDYIPMLQHELGVFGNPIAIGYAKRLLNKMIRRSDITLTVSEILADSIKGSNANVKVLPNGVDVNDFIYSGKDINIQCKKPVIGFIGAFEYFIDFDLILSVAQRLPEYTFLLVGGGREFERIEQKIKDLKLRNIMLTGGVPHSIMADYISKMDICLNVFKKIQVSHSACPIKLFEYLMMKKPVISTRLAETIKIDQGFLYYADTTDELERVINEILIDQEKAVKSAEKGYNTVIATYAWDKVVRGLISMIEKLRAKAFVEGGKDESIH